LDGTDPRDGGAGGGSVPPISPTNRSTINLTWTDNATNEYGFEVERSLSQGTGFALVATVGAATVSYEDTDLDPLTRYYYRIRAYNNSGNSGYSNEADAMTEDAPPPPPSAPSDLTATATSRSSIALTWTDTSDNEDSFELERSESPDSGFAPIASVDPETESFEDIDLDPGTQYYYRLFADSETAGPSDYSNTAAPRQTRFPQNRRSHRRICRQQRLRIRPLPSYGATIPTTKTVSKSTAASPPTPGSYLSRPLALTLPVTMIPV